MNYTSTRYDGPYGPNGGRGGPANMATVKSPQGVTRAGQPTHSASSSSSSIDGGHNMAGVGSHPSGNSSSGSYGSAGQLQQHHYDSSGEYDHRFPGAARQLANGGPAMRAYAMQQQHHAQHQMGYPAHHRHAQLSDDYEGGSQYAAYNGQYPHRAADATPTYAQPSARMDREMDREREQGEGDTSFDFLLSPGLAPVGPISTSSSLGPMPPALGLPPSQSQANLPPPLVHSNSFLPQSVTPSRPTFNRSQTAMPAPSGSGRAFQPPSNYAHQQQPIYAADHSSSSGLGASAGSAAHQQGQQGSRDYAPPPAISAQALLDIVLNMRADQPTSGQPQAGPSSTSAMMSRSQSANAAARLQQANQVPAHMRNTSTGSTKSDDDPIMQGNQLSGALQVPSHPGMARTASSRNLNDNQAALRTIDLTHHRIGDVPVEVIDALEGSVGRLALGYNYITTLSPSFARLGNTLRYLNIRLNMLTTFPAVLCEMPSLEILDISRNKIKRLPAQCGSLKGLRVFSISKNRVKRLPTYFADMKQLRVLKIDHNPLEWPPREITTQPPSASPAEGQSKRENDAAQSKLEAQALQKWLTGLQDWIREHANEPNVPPSMSLRQDDSSDLAAPRGRPEPAHGHSDIQIARTDREEPTSTPLDPPISAGSVVSPVQSSVTSVTGGMSPRDLPTIETDASRLSQHGRSESHSLAGGGAPRKPLLRSKKSLPDLRQNHAQILDERFHDDANPSAGESSQAGGTGAKAQSKHRKTPSTASPGLSPVSARPSEALPSLPNSASGERRYPIPGIMHGRSGSEEVDGLAPLPSALDNALSRGRRNINGQLNNHSHQNGGERGTSGAYFKRLSMLPASTISKAVPSTLLRFIEGIRGIFFSLSQMHASLKQCIVSPATDRLPAVFTKMMASADDAMGFLIDALDKFDSTTRRGMPDTAIVKDVVETCRENLTIFGKLVTIILNQSKNLFHPNSDVRYMRALVLGLFGAIGEIEISWNGLGPLREDIVRWLRGETDLSPTSLQLQPPTPSPQEGSFPPLHTQPGQASPIPQRSQASPGLSSSGTPLAPGRVPLAKARRHAGSFSKYPPYPA